VGWRERKYFQLWSNPIFNIPTCGKLMLKNSEYNTAVSLVIFPQSWVKFFLVNR